MTKSKSNAYRLLRGTAIPRQDILHITTREHTFLPIHLVQKSTIIRAQKIGNPRFEISYSIAALSGSAEKNLNTGTQLQTIAYIKPPKLLTIARLNSVSVSTIGGTAVRFYTSCMNLTVFRGIVL